MRTNLCRAAVVVVLLVGGAAPAAAHDLLRLSGGVANQWAWTDSVDALQSDDRFLAAELRLGVGVWQGISVEAGYRCLEGGGTTFADGFDTEVRFDTIDLGARYDWPLLSWLSLYGRAGAAAARVATAVEWAAARVASASWTPGLYGSVGVDARFPRRWFGGVDDADGGSGFTVRLAFDVGYAWFLPVEVTGRARPGGGLDADSEHNGEIGQAALELGSLSVHGLTYQLGLVVHY